MAKYGGGGGGGRETERLGQELALVRHELSILRQKEMTIISQMEDLKHEKVGSSND